ncbi:MAG: RNA polymerase sigma factor [Planctomycetota bacterium]|nr:RNA polymerase sigma factor [Planctomycetota bacterium]
MDLGQTQTLILRALDGTEKDKSTLLEYLRPRLVLWAAGRLSPALRSKLEPDDVAQEALIAIHRGIGGFQGRDDRQFLAWVFKIAENRIRDLADHHGAQKRQPVIPPQDFSQTSPSTAAARREEVDRVARALPGLPDDYRQVLSLRRFEEREVREIAEIMDRSENAVRILYCRALKALRKAMDDGAEDGGPVPQKP